MSAAEQLTQAGRPGVGDRHHVVRCNHCRELVLHEHRSTHALQCRQRRNRAKLSRLNLEKNGQQVYAVVATRLRNGQWCAPIIEHVHATCSAHARAQFLAGENKNTTRVLEIGLAIGWFQDAQGNLYGSQG